VLVPSLALAGVAPRIVTGHVTSVTISYAIGTEAKSGDCGTNPNCRSDRKLSRHAPATYGAWEARHLKWQLNHLRRVGKVRIFCPLSYGNGYVITFHHRASKAATVIVEGSGCRFVSNGQVAGANRWSTPRLQRRLRQLLVGSCICVPSREGLKQ
jgi:hypothetical protein